MTRERLARLVLTLLVLTMCASCTGYIYGTASANTRAEECSAAVKAAMDDWQGVDGAAMRFADHASRCDP
ncbi:hypothetical protein [Brevibacterium album]|uniref:hypothetical protein n=1 Tax=Brevibacterium album TaxID=417948 RepID=UPI000409B9FB|nr:hypothetical protein [Brevibacterium album]